MHRLLTSSGRGWRAGAVVALVAALFVAGCDLSGLTGASCTPQTCDYVVSTLVAVTGAGGTPVLLADSPDNSPPDLYQFDGTTWNKVGSETASQRGPLIASPAFATDQTLFLGNSVSNDGGKTWTPLCAIVNAVSPSYATDKTIFGTNAIVGTGAAPTATPTVGPQTPTPTSNGAPSGCPTSSGPFYVSTNGGQSWSAGTGPQGASQPNLFILSPSFGSDQTIFATFSIAVNQQPAPALFKSTDGGQSWNKVLDGKQNVLAVSSNYAADQTVIAVSATAMQISTNGGGNWTSLTPPTDPTQVAEVAFSPNYAKDKTMLLVSAAVDQGSTTPHGTYVSTDGGKTWTLNGPAAQRGQNFPAVIFSPAFATDQTIYASSLDHGQGPAKSTDLGKTWTAINTGLTLVAGL